MSARNIIWAIGALFVCVCDMYEGVQERSWAKLIFACMWAFVLGLNIAVLLLEVTS